VEAAGVAVRLRRRRSALSLKVIADHIRACAFTVADGVIPGNEGRGYVLRRITRRAIRHGYKLGARKPFFHKLVAALAAQMGEAYPELRREWRVTEVLKQEEERFFQTIATAWRSWKRRWPGHAADRWRHRLQAARHLRLPGRPDRRRLPRARRDGGRGRLQRRDEPPARAGPCAGKFKMAAGPGVQRAAHHLPRLRAPGVRRPSRVTALYVDGAPVPACPGR
jgi:alanyl-tRNA synthetase